MELETIESTRPQLLAQSLTTHRDRFVIEAELAEAKQSRKDTQTEYSRARTVRNRTKMDWDVLSTASPGDLEQISLAKQDYTTAKLNALRVKEELNAANRLVTKLEDELSGLPEIQAERKQANRAAQIRAELEQIALEEQLQRVKARREARRGIVQRFDPKRNFGFISSPPTDAITKGADVFFHGTNVVLTDPLKVGDRVEYFLNITSKGFGALHVQRLPN